MGHRFYIVTLSLLLGVLSLLAVASIFLVPGWWMSNCPSPSLSFMAMRYSSDVIEHDVVRDRVMQDWKGNSIPSLLRYIRWASKWNEKMEKTEWLIGLESQQAYEGIFSLLDEARGTSFDEITYQECLVGRLREIEMKGVTSKEMLQFVSEQLSKRRLSVHPTPAPVAP